VSAAAGAQPQAYPAYYAELVDRGTSMLRAHWPAAAVEFAWHADGEQQLYLARLEWPALAAAPRVIVTDKWSGDFRCQSKEGAWFEIDAAVVVVDLAADALDRDEWEKTQRCRGKRKS
jgi:hypothetical protein